MPALQPAARDDVAEGIVGQRETTYTNDLRGDAVLVTNAQAPHPFYKPDNMARAIAIGGFSSTANMLEGSDDPTTETSNWVSFSS